MRIHWGHWNVLNFLKLYLSLVGHYFHSFSSFPSPSNYVRGRTWEEWPKRWPREYLITLSLWCRKVNTILLGFLQKFLVCNNRLLIIAVSFLNCSLLVPFGCYYVWNVWNCSTHGKHFYVIQQQDYKTFNYYLLAYL